MQVRVPKPTRALARMQAADAAYKAKREGMRGRSVVRGLLLLAVSLLVASVWRAGVARAFMPGWWRLW